MGFLKKMKAKLEDLNGFLKENKSKIGGKIESMYHTIPLGEMTRSTMSLFTNDLLISIQGVTCCQYIGTLF